MCPLRYSSHPIMTQNSPVVKVTKLLGLRIQALMTVLSFSVSLSAQRKSRPSVSWNLTELRGKSSLYVFFLFIPWTVQMDHPKLVLIKLISMLKSFWRKKWTCRA